MKKKECKLDCWETQIKIGQESIKQTRIGNRDRDHVPMSKTKHLKL